MPNSETVNPQAVEDLALTERAVVGSAPAVAVGSSLQGMSHAASLHMLNVTQAYQNWNLSMQAIATQSAIEISTLGRTSARPAPKTSATGSKRPAARAAKKGKT